MYSSDWGCSMYFPHVYSCWSCWLFQWHISYIEYVIDDSDISNIFTHSAIYESFIRQSVHETVGRPLAQCDLVFVWANWNYITKSQSMTSERVSEANEFRSLRSLIHSSYIAVTHSCIWYITDIHNLFNIHVMYIRLPHTIKHQFCMHLIARVAVHLEFIMKSTVWIEWIKINDPNLFWHFGSPVLSNHQMFGRKSMKGNTNPSNNIL